MKEQVVLNGKTYEGERLMIVSETSLWSEALLSDGTVVRVRPVVSKAVFIPDLSDALSKPVYYLDIGLIKDMSIPIKTEGHQGAASG